MLKIDIHHPSPKNMNTIKDKPIKIDRKHNDK